MSSKLSDSCAYPPRAMRADRASAYLGLGRSFFLELVTEGKMPQPTRIRGAVLWDRHELDAAFEDLKNGGPTPTENSVHKRLKELTDAGRIGGSKVKVPVSQAG